MLQGNPYTLIELLPNNTTIPPPQAPQPLDLKTIPSTGGIVFINTTRLIQSTNSLISFLLIFF
jgi:hypothetical protein